MSKIKAFTLIELIIVVILVGIISYIAVANIKTAINPAITPDKFRDILSPNANLFIFRDSISIDKNISNIKITNPVVYDKDLKKINFKNYNDKIVVFKYTIKNGIQNSYILACNEGIFVFKPLETIKTTSLQKAKELLNMSEYLPKEGSYYK